MKEMSYARPKGSEARNVLRGLREWKTGDSGKLGLALALLLALVSAIVPTTAGAITFTASSGDLWASASVTFEQKDSNLVVTLTNTSTHDVLSKSDVLTAVFFTLVGDPDLKPVSAHLAADSSIVSTESLGDDVGGEWAYRNGLAGTAPLGAANGISSAAFGSLFGKDSLFGGTNLSGGKSPSNVDYGLTSQGDDQTTGGSLVKGDNSHLIDNSVVFTLELPSHYDLTDITNVSFQYGNALTDPNLAGVPEPGTLLLLGSGLIGMGIFGRRLLKWR